MLLQIFDRVVPWTAFSTGAGFSEKYMFSKMSEVPALPLMRSLLFQTIPHGPQIDHRRMMILGNMRQHGVHSLAIRCGAPAA